MLKASRLVHNAWIIMAVGLGLILAALVAIAWLALRSEEADRLVTHTVDVQQAAHSLLSLVRNAESGERAYVLTGHTEYLKPIDDAEARIPALLASIRRSRPTIRCNRRG